MSTYSGGFLTGDEIKKLQDRHTIFADGTYDRIQLGGLDSRGRIMYDLRLGDQVYRSMDRTPINLSEKDPYFVIKPGEFALLTTCEYLQMPMDIVGFISLRFTHASKGLINISGFHVDPGYEGRLIFSVYNAGPNEIILKHHEPVFMIFFAPLTKPVKQPYGKKYDPIPVDMIAPLKGFPTSLRNLDNRLRAMEARVRFLTTLLTSLSAAVIAGLIIFLITRL